MKHIKKKMIIKKKKKTKNVKKQESEDIDNNENDKEKGVSNNKGYTWLILFDGTNMKSYYIIRHV